MELRSIRPNTLVEHSELGVGQIIETEGPKVRFRFNPDHEKVVSMAEANGEAYRALPDDGLEAHFINDPDEVRVWANTAPLRLIAVTLLDLPGRRGMPKQLQERLEGRVVKDVSWKTWWDWARRHAKDSGYFDMAVSRDPIELTVPIAEVTKEPPARAATRAATGSKSKSTSKRSAKSFSEKEIEARTRQQRENHAAEVKQLREMHAIDVQQQRDSFARDSEQQRDSFARDLEQQRESFTKDLEQQRESFTKDLKRKDEEGERLHRQIQTLRAELNARREDSYVEIRKDMLLRIGDIIQRTYISDTAAEVRLSQVREQLPLALRDGGAELLGEVGEAVFYDSRLHHSWEEVTSGSMVRVYSPGVVVRGGSFGELVILKANVKPYVKDAT